MKNGHARALCETALMAALLAICTWLMVPMPAIPFTMQTFGIFFALKMLGGKRGTAAILLYLLLGAAGAPVFSGFRGGLGALLGPTGGYLLGFLIAGLWFRLWERRVRRRDARENLVLAAGQLIDYAFGTAWYLIYQGRQGKAVGIAAALTLCVLPYLIPDGLKLLLAQVLAKRLRKHLPAR